MGRAHEEMGEEEKAGQDTLSPFSPRCSLRNNQALCCFFPQHLTGQRNPHPGCTLMGLQEDWEQGPFGEQRPLQPAP